MANRLGQDRTICQHLLKFTRMTSQVPESARHVIISINPKSGARNRRNLAEDLGQRLTDSGFSVHLLSDIQKVQQLTQQFLSEDNLRCVVAAGGDGTVGLLVNQLPETTPIAILPLGTENLLAKHFGLTADPISVANAISAGRVACIDVGSANGQLFLVMVSCGFDAAVVRRLHSNRKRHIKHSSYIVPILKTIAKYRYPSIRVSAEGHAEAQGAWAFVFNVPRYALNLQFTPDANPQDGRLDLCTFRAGKLFRGLFYLYKLIRGKHQALADTEFRQSATMHFEADVEVPFQVDGDPGGYLPLTVTTLPGRLPLIVPPNWTETTTQDSLSQDSAELLKDQRA